MIQEPNINKFYNKIRLQGLYGRKVLDRRYIMVVAILEALGASQGKIDPLDRFENQIVNMG